MFMLIPSARGAIALFGLAILLGACSEASNNALPELGPEASESRLQPPQPEEGSPSTDMPVDGPLVLFMGTSLTEGYGLPDPDRQAWPARFAEEASRQGLPLEIRNAGVSGETSAGARRRVDWILDRPPALFVLETGANDGLRGLSPEQLEANLDSIFATVRRRAPEARLALAGMEAPPNLGTSYIEAFRAVFPRVAERWDAVLIPFLLDGVAGDRTLNQADGIHPTPPGHQRMAEVAWTTLEPVVRDLVDAESAVRP
ncbi:MAG: arylesterase [Gemmatimonadales bacterium]|nr:MAG: arylesterase [Gemmatimonadales bacterium]